VKGAGDMRDVDPITVRPAQACKMLNLGMTRLYEMLNDGTLQSFSEGGSRYVLVSSIRQWVADKLEKSTPPRGTDYESPGRRRRGRVRRLVGQRL
jgi:hypothetical protein